MGKDITPALAKSVIEKLQSRADGQGAWLNEEAQGSGRCFTEQLHTAEGTPERIYWHYGYRVALLDVINLLGDATAGQN